MSGLCDLWETEDNAYRALEEKSVPKSPLGRPRHRWKNNIKMDFQGVVGGHGLDLSGSG
jgi:hypothetical protein